MNKNIIVGIIAAIVVIALVVLKFDVLKGFVSKEKVTIKFDANGGEKVPDLITDKGAQILLPSTTRKGYLIDSVELNAIVKYPKGDKVEDYDKEDPYSVTFKNEKKNYEVNLTLAEEAGGTYEDNKEGSKQEEGYTEAKFGNYSGYYYKDGYDIEGFILLDPHDETNSYRYINFDVSLIDEYDNEKEEWKDVTPIFKSSRIQNILKSIEYKTVELDLEQMEDE